MAAILLPWSTKYLTGIDPIDRQHQSLIDKVNVVYGAMVRGAGVEVDKGLADLLRETEEHFRFEEGLMFEANYPDLTAHRLQHELLLTRARQQLEAFKDGTITSMQLARFVSTWVSAHIVQSDLLYVPWLQSAAA